MVVYVLLIAMSLGMIYNIYKFLKNEVHTKILWPKKILSFLFLAAIVFMYFKFSDLKIINLAVGLVGWIFFVSGFLAEGFSTRGVTITPNSLFISIFSNWRDLDKVKYMKLEKGNTLVNFKVSSWEIRQVYSDEEIKKFKKYLKEN